jgi:hypothetical protein
MVAIANRNLNLGDNVSAFKSLVINVRYKASPHKSNKTAS